MEYADLNIVILAAGNSSRMGQSKQLLDVGGQTLLEKTVSAAVESKIPNVTVVLGANAEIHRRLLKNYPVQILVNNDWALGMGSTLKFALKKILEDNINVQGVLFMVCDQPNITVQHINKVCDLFLSEKPIAVASQYKMTFGVPALFDRITFSSLLSINDHAGAKEVLEKVKNDLRLIPFEGGEIDLDTLEDYQNFINQKL